jgi:hypothetical protein
MSRIFLARSLTRKNRVILMDLRRRRKALREKRKAENSLIRNKTASVGFRTYSSQLMRENSDLPPEVGRMSAQALHAASANVLRGRKIGRRSSQQPLQVALGISYVSTSHTSVAYQRT